MTTAQPLQIPFKEFHKPGNFINSQSTKLPKFQETTQNIWNFQKKTVSLREYSRKDRKNDMLLEIISGLINRASFIANKTFNTNNMTFTEAKQQFDAQYGNSNEFQNFLPEHLSINKQTCFRKLDGNKNEQYYKWQFLSAVVHSGLFPKDLIGTEVHFPKGNKSSAAIKLDAAIFDDASWFDKYKDYHNNNDADALDWLRKHLIVALEFKKEDGKNVAEVWDKQLKAYMRESEADFCLGVLYDTERLYLFRKHNNKYLRYSEEFNTKGEESSTKELSLHLPDSYLNIPNLEHVINYADRKQVDRSKRTIHDLDVISGVQSIQITNAMSAILRKLDLLGMVDQFGFTILVNILALKIYDEKQNEKFPTRHLQFYVTPEEVDYTSLADVNVQKLITRTKSLLDEAKAVYYRILSDSSLDFRNENHIKILIEVISQFQDYSFVRSEKTDLYQMVFYKFAGPFSKEQHAQFITPLPMIDFLVNIVNPRNGESVIDPTVGIADFLSVSYVNSRSKLDDKNIFGMDIDDQMVRLATLNMLLNGDGNAKIISQPGLGSILSKFDVQGEPINLIPSMNKNGNWDNRPDNKQLKKFDVVLTNPPFGEDRAFTPQTEQDKAIIQCYELWNIYGNKIVPADTQEDDSKKKSKKTTSKLNKIDMGVVFLENAYRILKENGRLGIVLSNSIASIDAHKKARQWLMDKMRIVALFDLPANVFAETGVNTTIIVAYKPSDAELNRLKEQNYSIFVRDIKNVGYEVKTSQRVKYFAPTYRINYETFEPEIDVNGNACLDEDFTSTIADFRQWCLTQEQTLQELFIKEK